MKRMTLVAVSFALLGSTGCSSNPLIGKWQSVEGGQLCGTTLTFTATQGTRGDATPTPGDAVTYRIEDKVVYVSGTATMIGGLPIPYNIVDKDHIALVLFDGTRCNYVRVK